jgi:hypothetical protein
VTGDVGDCRQATLLVEAGSQRQGSLDSGSEKHQPDDGERYDRQRRARNQEIADRRSPLRLPRLLRAFNDLFAALERHWVILFPSLETAGACPCSDEATGSGK